MDELGIHQGGYYFLIKCWEDRGTRTQESKSWSSTHGVSSTLFPKLAPSLAHRSGSSCIPIALGRKFIHNNSCIYDNRVNVYSFEDLRSLAALWMLSSWESLRPGPGSHWRTLGSELLSGCCVFLLIPSPSPAPHWPCYRRWFSTLVSTFETIV